MESFLGYLDYLRIIAFALEPKKFVDVSTDAKLQNPQEKYVKSECEAPSLE